MERDRAVTPNKKPGGKAISYLFVATRCSFPPAAWSNSCSLRQGAENKAASPDEHGEGVRLGTMPPCPTSAQPTGIISSSARACKAPSPHTVAAAACRAFLSELFVQQPAKGFAKGWQSSARVTECNP